MQYQPIVVKEKTLKEVVSAVLTVCSSVQEGGVLFVTAMILNGLFIQFSFRLGRVGVRGEL